MSLSDLAGRPAEVKGYFDFSLGPGSVMIPSRDLSENDSRIATNLHIPKIITMELSQKGIHCAQPQTDKLAIRLVHCASAKLQGLTIVKCQARQENTACRDVDLCIRALSRRSAIRS